MNLEEKDDLLLKLHILKIRGVNMEDFDSNTPIDKLKQIYLESLNNLKIIEDSETRKIILGKIKFIKSQDVWKKFETNNDDYSDFGIQELTDVYHSMLDKLNITDEQVNNCCQLINIFVMINQIQNFKGL